MTVTLVKAISTGMNAWTFPGDDPLTPARARDLVRGLLRHLDAELVYDAMTVTSELVTNACRHTRSGCQGGKVSLGVVATCRAVTITALDYGSASTPTISPAGRVESGRGLALCAELGELTIDTWTRGHLVMVRIPLDLIDTPDTETPGDDR